MFPEITGWRTMTAIDADMWYIRGQAHGHWAEASISSRDVRDACITGSKDGILKLTLGAMHTVADQLQRLDPRARRLKWYAPRRAR